MSQEILAILEFWQKEKGFSREQVVEAVKQAIMSAARRSDGPGRDIKCVVDQKTGSLRTFVTLVVVDKVVTKNEQISLADARRIKPDAQLGEGVEREIPLQDFFGRIAAQQARQALVANLRKMEKQMIFSEFRDRVGEIVSGVIRRFDRSDVIVDLTKFEALLPNEERVPTEEFQVGDRIRCFVKAVENKANGPEIILSRADPRFVSKLFQLEVSEISDGTIEIKGIAREPGYRTKLAVHSRDLRVDPVGACVGLRGGRVKNIVRELNNEKVDIIPWDANIRNYLANALAPAKLRQVEVDERNRRVRILVAEDQLSLAIGKRGQNARLTSKLTGWHVDIQQDHVVNPGFEAKVAEAVSALAAVPGIGENLANVLVHAGFLGLEDLVQVDLADLAAIPAVGEAAPIIVEAVKSELAKRQTPAQPEVQPAA